MSRRMRSIVIGLLVACSISLGGYFLLNIRMVSDGGHEKIVSAVRDVTDSCGNDYALRIAILTLDNENLNIYARRCEVSSDDIGKQANEVLRNPDLFVFTPDFSENYYAIHRAYFEKACERPTVYCRLKTFFSDTFYDVRLRISGDPTSPFITKSYGNSF